jgi:hypothetical protein
MQLAILSTFLFIIFVGNASSYWLNGEHYPALYCECERCLDEIQTEPPTVYPLYLNIFGLCLL